MRIIIVNLSKKMAKKPHSWIYRTKPGAPSALRLVHDQLNRNTTQKELDDLLGCAPGTINRLINDPDKRPKLPRNLIIALSALYPWIQKPYIHQPIYKKEDLVLGTQEKIDAYLVLYPPTPWTQTQRDRARRKTQVITPYLMKKLGFVIVTGET